MDNPSFVLLSVNTLIHETSCPTPRRDPRGPSSSVSSTPNSHQFLVSVSRPSQGPSLDKLFEFIKKNINRVSQLFLIVLSTWTFSKGTALIRPGRVDTLRLQIKFRWLLREPLLNQYKRKILLTRPKIHSTWPYPVLSTVTMGYGPSQHR